MDSLGHKTISLKHFKIDLTTFWVKGWRVFQLIFTLFLELFSLTYNREGHRIIVLKIKLIHLKLFLSYVRVALLKKSGEEDWRNRINKKQEVVKVASTEQQAQLWETEQTSQKKVSLYTTRANLFVVWYQYQLSVSPFTWITSFTAACARAGNISIDSVFIT